MKDELVNLLESLSPRQGNRIIDLVEYEWAFGGSTEPTLLCVWHSSISIIDGKIAVEDNLRQLAIDVPRRSAILGYQALPYQKAREFRI